MKLNSKTFFAVFITFGIQFLVGISYANAVCDNEIRVQCSEETKLPPGGRDKFCDEGKNEEVNYWINYFKEDRKNFSSPQEQLRDRKLTNDDSYNRVSVTYKSYTKAGNDVLMCLLNHTLGNGNSSSGSSSQSNQKANRQSADNQSSTSSSSDLSNKSRDQLIDIASTARDRGDYAKAYAALIQLAKDPDPEISRQALRNAGFHLKEGQGVKQNLFEAHRLFQQAASMGDLSAHSHLCSNFMDGTGVAENHRTALEYCLFAAERGHMTAQANLAWLYENGNGIQRSQRLSDQWTCKAAAQGEEAAVGNVKKQNIRCN